MTNSTAARGWVSSRKKMATVLRVLRGMLPRRAMVFGMVSMYGAIKTHGRWVVE